MASKIGKKEWWFVYGVAGTIDAVEFLTDLFLTEFFAVPEAVWTIVDRVVGIIAVAYFELRGVRIITHPSRLLSMVGVQGLEFITGGAAPAWVVDVWYIKKSVMAEEAAIKAQKEQEEMLQNVTVQAAYQDGMRQPTKNVTSPSGPLHKEVNGKSYRLPQGGIKLK
jgi:hypothetical protein